MRDPHEDAKQERRVLSFFAVLGLIIVLTLARGCYNGELNPKWNKYENCGELCETQE
jgi:hypothetical protein